MHPDAQAPCLWQLPETRLLRAHAGQAGCAYFYRSTVPPRRYLDADGNLLFAVRAAVAADGEAIIWTYREQQVPASVDAATLEAALNAIATECGAIQEAAEGGTPPGGTRTSAVSRGTQADSPPVLPEGMPHSEAEAVPLGKRAEGATPAEEGVTAENSNAAASAAEGAAREAIRHTVEARGSRRFGLAAKKEKEYGASEAEALSYERIPGRIVDVDGLTIDFFATVMDWRNWPGSTGQRQQAVLLALLRQWNQQPSSNARVLQARGTISLNAVQKATGMHRATIEKTLTALAQRSLIDVRVEKGGTNEACHVATLCLPVSRWQLPVIHHWQEARKAGMPF